MRQQYVYIRMVSFFLIVLLLCNPSLAQTKVFIENPKPYYESYTRYSATRLPSWVEETENRNDADFIIRYESVQRRGFNTASPTALIWSTLIGSILGGVSTFGIQGDDREAKDDNAGVWTGSIIGGVIGFLVSGMTGPLVSYPRIELFDLTTGESSDKVFSEYKDRTPWLEATIRSARNDITSPSLSFENLLPEDTDQSHLSVRMTATDDVRLWSTKTFVNGKMTVNGKLIGSKTFDFNSIDNYSQDLLLPLQLGTNNIRFHVTDWCGRSTEETFTVFRKKSDQGTDDRTQPTLTSYPPLLSIINPKFIDESSDGFLDAGEGGLLSFQVVNNGQGDANDLNISAVIAPDAGIAIADIKAPISIKADTEETAEISFIASAAVPNATAIIELMAEDNLTGSPARPVSVDVKARALWSDVDLNVPRTRMERLDDIAVIIGNQSYDAKDTYPVDFASRDAEAIRQYATDVLGFKRENIIYETNVYLSDLRSIFGTEINHKGRLYNLIKADYSDVFIYYSGHGAPGLADQRGYLLPVDVTAADAEVNGYSLELLTSNLSKLPARSVTVVIEACFSGLGEQGLLISDISPPALRVQYPQLRLPNGNFFMASKTDQVASWFPEMKHGLFTYYFLKGLRGEADSNEDNKVTLGEMGAYLNETVPYKVRRLVGREQDPEIFLSQPDRVLVSY